jgi:hypothetical protein
MADAQVIINQPGPLPIKTQFSVASDGSVGIMVSGSVWSTAVGMVGIQVTIDGKAFGAATIYANVTTSHMSAVPILLPSQFSFGTHTIELSAMTGSTMSDQNDSYLVTILY